MADITLNIIHELKKENADLRRELRERCTELKEWKEKAEALCHIATYTAEVSNRKGLTLISKGELKC